MSGDDLHVTALHLNDLAARQGKAASESRSATVAVEGVDAAVRSTHGCIASSTATAVEAVISARRDAGTKMAAISDDLGRKLTDAAQRYAAVDQSSGDALDGQMQAG